MNRRPAYGGGPAGAPARAPRARDACMALVDAQYLQWLLQRELDAPADALAVTRVRPMLGGLLSERGASVDLRRIYWYSPEQPSMLPDHHVLRVVAAGSADNGQTLVRAMAADLQALAQRHACRQLVVVSDDDRLAHAIDEAQLHGMEVTVAVGDPGTDARTLMQDDPDLARLLMQADRRLLLSHAQLSGLLQRGPQGAGAGMGPGDRETDDSGGPSASAADIEAWMKERIGTWWSEQSSERQAEIAASLQDGEAIPQELDRELLYGTRENLGRQLDAQEKRVMRKVVREVVAEGR